MTNINAKTESIRRLRGAILKALVAEHPNYVDSKVLHVILVELGYRLTTGECSGHLSYLGGKGYVESEKRKASGIELEMAVITPMGIDLLDGFKEDIGISVEGL